MTTMTIDHAYAVLKEAERIVRASHAYQSRIGGPKPSCVEEAVADDLRILYMNRCFSNNAFTDWSDDAHLAREARVPDFERLAQEFLNRYWRSDDAVAYPRNVEEMREAWEAMLSAKADAGVLK